MNLNQIPAGKDIPNAFNTIIEIPARGEPVKYEVDKDTGSLIVDRFLSTPMYYPCNYGYIPQTLSDDGDPVDVLVITPTPLISGSVIKCRAVGLLDMADEKGADAKILAVPTNDICNLYQNVNSHEDVSPHMLSMIVHFFEHYKDLERNKWAKIKGWLGVKAAKQEIIDSVKRYKEKPVKA
ncbi:MAG: inorganic diphosphatase [Pseudomonadota bacterium]